MKGMARLIGFWNSQSLARQFLAAGGVVWLTAMLVIGALVSHLIERAVTRNSAAATALYVDGLIAPLLPDLKTGETIDEVTRRALDETFAQSPLKDRIFSFRLWRPDGLVLYSTEKDLVGKTFAPNEDLAEAMKGSIVAQLGLADDPESGRERDAGKPLLEIYNPVLQPWTGEVVAVSEFYERAEDFRASLATARRQSWMAVAGAAAIIFLTLSAIVVRGSRTIEEQSGALAARVEELSALLSENRLLNERLQRASRRTAALNESHLRRIGADLHDGPAQLIAYAALRLGSRRLTDPALEPGIRTAELDAIKMRLDEAMDEIRSICSGLVLPHIEHLALCEVIERAARAHEHRTGTAVRIDLSGVRGGENVPVSVKICVYRFVQEALNNAFRHAGGRGQAVSLSLAGDQLAIEVCDEGPGFDPACPQENGIGLTGMRERIAALGGDLDIETSGRGTCLRLRLGLPTEEMT